MKKILFILILLSLTVKVFADDTIIIVKPLTLSNFNMEFNYNYQNLNISLQNFNMEFNYVESSPFNFELGNYKSDYERFNKLSGLYAISNEKILNREKWGVVALNEKDNYYNAKTLPILKWYKLDLKY